MSMVDANYLQQFVDENSFMNRLVLGALLPGWIWQPLPHMVQTWLRNYFGATLIYLLSCSLWSFYVYVYKYNVYIPEGDIPTRRAMWLQIKVAMKAMPWYAIFATISEYMVENGWTRCYSSINEVGRAAYAWNLFLYFIFTEFTIYWTHRLLHDIKPLYKHLHSKHHIYNKQNTISPFAGYAFHPLDGILQAIPHVIVLFLVPTHYTTLLALFFLVGIWTANIHDCIHGNVWPLMGAGYHIVHHTTYRHNYGNYTVWMDWMFGTLRVPPLEDEAKKI